MPPFTLPKAAGTAIVEIDLTAEGKPENPQIVQSTGDILYDQAAIKTVLIQQFAPEVRDCVNVKGSYLYEVDYP
jgi:TonB family protein